MLFSSPGEDAAGVGEVERDEVGDTDSEDESSRNHTGVSSEARQLTSNPLCKSEDVLACTLFGRRDFDVAFFGCPFRLDNFGDGVVHGISGG